MSEFETSGIDQQKEPSPSDQLLELIQDETERASRRYDGLPAERRSVNKFGSILFDLDHKLVDKNKKLYTIKGKTPEGKFYLVINRSTGSSIKISPGPEGALLVEPQPPLRPEDNPWSVLKQHQELLRVQYPNENVLLNGGGPAFRDVKPEKPDRPA